VKAAPRFDCHVEPLAECNDRAAFHSGDAELDRYLQQQAGQDAKRKVATPFVLLDGANAILGYYTLSAYGLRLSELPASIARRFPRYPLLPATLLGRLAVSSSCRGQSLGRYLLMDALFRSWRSVSQVASVGVVVEAASETARAFYLHHEFTQLQDHPDKLFLYMATIEQAFKNPGSKNR